MKKRCAHCRKWFTLSLRQEKNGRNPSTRHIRPTCSSTCRALLAVAARDCVNRLDKKRLAYSRLQNARDTGAVVRPDECESCGARAGVDRLGRAKIHGHHDDYAHPLAVRWLCTVCHNKVSLATKQENGNTGQILDKEAARIIRQLYNTGVISGPKLGRIFGVGKKTVYDIVKGRTWGHV